jgi:hypothetical protein
MTDDNIIGIDGRQAAQLRTDQAEREKREEILCHPDRPHKIYGLCDECFARCHPKKARKARLLRAAIGEHG